MVLTQKKVRKKLPLRSVALRGSGGANWSCKMITVKYNLFSYMLELTNYKYGDRIT